MIIDTTQTLLEKKVAELNLWHSLLFSPCPDLEFSNTLISDLAALVDDSDRKIFAEIVNGLIQNDGLI